MVLHVRSACQVPLKLERKVRRGKGPQIAEVSPRVMALNWCWLEETTGKGINTEKTSH